MPRLDRRLLGQRDPARPRVLTLHYPLPPPGERRKLAAQRRYLDSFDAVVAHTETAAARLRDEVGLDPAKVEVIPHGPFDYLTEPRRRAAAAGRARPGAKDPVILFFGLLRPYKGIDTLLEAFAAGRGRRALDRRDAADAARAAAEAGRTRRRDGSASCPASSPTRRSRR